MEISFRTVVAEADVVLRAGIRTYRAAQLIAQKTSALENRTVARDLYDIHFLSKHHSDSFSPEVVARLRELTSDLDRLEARFMPAFEEDDLFRDKTGLVPGLVLEIREALG